MMMSQAMPMTDAERRANYAAQNGERRHFTPAQRHRGRKKHYHQLNSPRTTHVSQELDGEFAQPVLVHATDRRAAPPIASIRWRADAVPVTRRKRVLGRRAK
jgi:hypothetical protein